MEFSKSYSIRKMQMDTSMIICTQNTKIEYVQHIDFTNNWANNGRKSESEREKSEINLWMWIYLLISRFNEFQFNRLFAR